MVADHRLGEVAHRVVLGNSQRQMRIANVEPARRVGGVGDFEVVHGLVRPGTEGGCSGGNGYSKGEDLHRSIS